MELCIVLISNKKANTTLGIHIPSNFENWQPFVVCGSVTSGVMFFFYIWLSMKTFPLKEIFLWQDEIKVV